MLNTYIKNRGMTKTIIHNNNYNKVNKIAWDADYDGDIANISFDTNLNGKHNHYDIKLDNQDLAHILNIGSVNIPIHKRLQSDFENSYSPPKEYLIELPDKLSNHGISSPKTNEELIIPITIDKKTADKYTLTPKKKHKRKKSHVTYKVYKKLLNSGKSKKYSKSKSNKTKSKSNKSTSILELF